MRGRLGRLVLALLLCYLVADFNTQVPGKAMYGQNINPPSVWKLAEGNSFVLATYNIRRSKGDDGQRDIKRSVNVLMNAGADIVGLNELSGSLFYGLTDQAEQIGQLLDAGWLFAPTYQQFFQNHFGNGIISRFPVDGWRVYPLLTSDEHDASFRNMVIVKIPFANNEIYVLNTHLDRSKVRVEQLRQVLGHFESLPSPAVLVGDLNTRLDDNIMTDFLSNPAYVDATYMINEEHDVEWIIAKGLTILSGGTEPVGVSDHPAYWVEFAIN